MQSKFIQDLMAPADPERFLAMTRVYQKAARAPAGCAYRVPDMPMTRGMLAVVAAMRAHGDSEQHIRATTMRLVHLEEVFDAWESFGEYIRPGDSKDCLEVADVLMKAVAVARIRPAGEAGCFDLAEVLAQAERFDAEQAQATAGTAQAPQSEVQHHA